MFVVRDREAGNIIEYCGTYEEAKKLITQYEEEDMNDNIFEPNFYEIFRM